MKDPLLQAVTEFLRKRYKNEYPLLLAFSGGPDSLALLHVLLEYSRRFPLKVALAHVDHGWRPESAQEADLIGKMAAGLGLPLHIKRLDPKAMQGNLEAACREERLTFFGDLCREYGYGAILLGHHADDQAETVLKRTLEGVALPYLAGMHSETLLYDLKLWRPLLSVTKKQVLAWLEQRGLKGFEDSTNKDPRFLRGKFRTRIIPLLSEEFGKEIAPALCRLGEEAEQLHEYLNSQVAPYLDQAVSGPFGSLLDLSLNCPASPVISKHLIRCFCERHLFALSKDALETAALLLETGAANKQIKTGPHTLSIDRKRLSIGKEGSCRSKLTVEDE